VVPLRLAAGSETTEVPERSHGVTAAQAYVRKMGRRLDPLAARYIEACGREALEALLLQIERDGERMRPALDPAVVRELRKTLGLPGRS
jgi:hypothetical protein